MHALIYLVSVAINIGAAYFVYQDAQSRSNPNAIAWAIGTFFCCPIVPIIYFVMRGRSGAAAV